MNHSRWLEKNGISLAGKTVAVTGATGGLGSVLCRNVLALGGSLILLNRSAQKTDTLRTSLLRDFPDACIDFLQTDLTDMDNVKTVCDALLNRPLDYLVLNAGAYSIPRATCSTGFDNVFQTNFVSHYYMVHRLLPLLNRRGGTVVAVGSIAHTYSKTDPEDMDFATRKGSSLVYGNSKRYLMFALTELMKDQPHVRFAIAHPGISFTNITAHYPKYLFAIIKYPMKVIFMKPSLAVRSLVLALCRPVPSLSWVGPRLFNIWGNPSVKKLRTCSPEERARIFETAETIYNNLSDASKPNHIR